MVEYSREYQARAAEELGHLPPGSAIEQMLTDYQVMRDQARAWRDLSEQKAEFEVMKFFTRAGSASSGSERDARDIIMVDLHMAFDPLKGRLRICVGTGARRVAPQGRLYVG